MFKHYFNGDVSASISLDCREGWYGINCTQHCVGQCKDGVTCNHVTGQCDEGCDAGSGGVLCDKGNTCYNN